MPRKSFRGVIGKPIGNDKSIWGRPVGGKPPRKVQGIRLDDLKPGRKRAKRKGWDFTIWRPVPEAELDLADVDVDVTYDEHRATWKTTTNDLSGHVIALEFEGYAARPLCRPEDGLHRLVSADGNAVVDVWELEEYAGWPWSHQFELTLRTYVARTYNYRTREVNMPNQPAVKLDPDDPFATMEGVLEEIAWRITDSEWE